MQRDLSNGKLALTTTLALCVIASACSVNDSTEPPSTTQPPTTQPSTTQPPTTQPSTTLPSTTQPSTTLPSTTQPSTTLPPTTLPSAPDPPALEEFWRVQIGSTGADTSYGVSATPNGEVIIVGSTEGDLAAPNQGQRDLYLARYSTNGEQIWELQTGGKGNDSPLGVSVATDGSIYVGGYTDGSFAGPHQGSADIWLARFDSAGNELWRRQFGSNKWDRGFDVSAFDGGVYISGYSSGSLDPGSYQGGFDGFAARFDSAGNQQWIRQFGTTATEWGQGSALAADGGLFVTGYTEGDFGATNAGDKDLFVVRLSPEGELLWVTQLGSEALDWTQGVGLGLDGSVLVAGSTQGSFAAPLGDDSDMIVVSLDDQGVEQWRWQSTLPEPDSAFEVRQIGDRVIATGTIYNPDSAVSAESTGVEGDTEALPFAKEFALVWLSTTGESLAIGSFGSQSTEEATGLAVADNGSIFWSGYTNGSMASDNAGASDLFLSGLRG